MSNLTIEEKGLKWISDKLESEGWITKRVHRTGYDIEARKGSTMRFIEVKTTSKERFTQRWLEAKQVNAMNTYKKQYFVYLISE